MLQIDTICLGLAALLMAGAVAERCTLQKPADARSYQEQVRRAFVAFPTGSGNWVSQDRPVPTEAMKMLRPNSILSRSYSNAVTGERCSVLLIDCTDARDLLCHYPPVCYPGQGWSLVSRQPKEWSVGGETVVGTNYEFSRTNLENSSGIVAANTMILPDGRFRPDMRGIEEAAKDVYRRGYGAAQMHVIVDSAIDKTQRDRIVLAMLELHKPLLDAIRSAPR